jgi:hypothetical protein
MDPILLFLPVVIIVPLIPVLALAFVPLDVLLSLELAGEIRVGVSVSFGPLGLRMRYGRDRLEILVRDRVLLRTRIPAAPGHSRRRNGPGPRGIPSGRIRDLTECPHTLMRIALRLLGQVSFRSLRAEMRIGLSSPFDTGILFGTWAALRPFLSAPPDRIVSITPVFDREVFEGSVEAAFRIRRPVRLAAEAIRAFTDPLVRTCVSPGAG